MINSTFEDVRLARVITLMHLVEPRTVEQALRQCTWLELSLGRTLVVCGWIKQNELSLANEVLYSIKGDAITTEQVVAVLRRIADSKSEIGKLAASGQLCTGTTH